MAQEPFLPKILLVEDDTVFRMFVKRLIGQEFHIREASCIDQARSHLVSERFACLLLDYRLPDGTGFQLLPYAVSLELPVVMMTAMGHEQLASDALRQGCSAYLVKDDITRATLRESLASAIV